MKKWGSKEPLWLATMSMSVSLFLGCCGMGWGSKCYGERDCQPHQSIGACPVSLESLN
jgi:hypothetical protein